MALQTSLFESLKIEKMNFENDSQLYTIQGKITEFGTEYETEIHLHYSEVNQLFSFILKSEESTFLYNCLETFDTPEGIFYEMDIEKNLGYSLHVDMGVIRSLNRMKRCA